MRRLALALCAALAFGFLVAAPAQAAMLKTQCRTLVDDGLGTVDKVCVQVTYHAMAGVPGLSVDRIQLSVNDAGGWNTVAVDCSLVKITNANGVVTWSRSGNTCDVLRDPGYHEFAPYQDMPQSVYADVRWNGNANMTGVTDQDFTITAHLTQ